MDLSALGVFSASGDITSALEDIIMSVGVSLGDVQCIGRYHNACGDITSALGIIQCILGES